MRGGRRVNAPMVRQSATKVTLSDDIMAVAGFFEKKPAMRVRFWFVAAVQWFYRTSCRAMLLRVSSDRRAWKL